MENKETKNPLFVKENSFKRLANKPFMLLDVKTEVEDVLKIILLWPPGRVELLQEQTKTLIFVSELNSFQMMQFISKNIKIYYLNENRNFIPWDHFCREKAPPFTIIYKSGKNSLIQVDKFINYTELINIKIGSYPVVKEGLNNPIELDLDLMDCDLKDPVFFLFSVGEYDELIRIFKLNLVSQSNNLSEKEFEYKFIEMAKEKYILIKKNTSYNKEIIDRLAARSLFNYYQFYKDIIYVENGKRITPHLPEKLIMKNFDYDKVYFFSSQIHNTAVFTLSDTEMEFQPIIELGKLMTAIYSKRIKYFANIK